MQTPGSGIPSTEGPKRLHTKSWEATLRETKKTKLKTLAQNKVEKLLDQSGPQEDAMANEEGMRA